MTFVAGDIWKQALDLILKQDNSLGVKTYVLPLEPVSCNNNDFVLAAPTHFIKDFAQPYLPLIENALLEVSSIRFRPKLVLLEEEKNVQRPSLLNRSFPEETTNENQLNEKYTFDNFVVGESNRFAHSACIAVAEHTGLYNPLFLYGGSGLGKTHLMHAIGNYVQQNQPLRKVLYVPCERFVNEFIQMIKEGRYEKFRNKYRSCNMLLIDDIQFLESKEQTQIEFFGTFNELYERGANIIMTCDKPPQNLLSLTERLRTRFSSGLMIDISQPDFETRCAILEKRSSLDGVVLPQVVVEYIARAFPSNIRELEGAYQTVLAYSYLSGSITLESCQNALRNHIARSRQKPTSETILEVITHYFQISPDDLKSKKKSKEQALARQIAMYLLSKHTQATYESIAQLLGKHHSTVLHGCNKIQDALRAEDPEILAIIQDLNQRISGQENQ